MSFITIDQHEDYEILNEFPFTIRKKSNGRVVTVGTDGKGYFRVYLNGKPYLLHRLIALQFILNDDPIGKPFVDHISRDRSDYRICNLRWVSAGENQLNRTSRHGITYEYIDYDEVNADQLIAINVYNQHNLRNIYYDVVENRFLLDTGVEYRVMPVSYSKAGSALVQTKSLLNKQVSIHFNRIKELYAEQITNALSMVL